jgi:hypothetical protein
MSSYDPELISAMQAALDEAMTKIPVEQATLTMKVQLAEFILKTAADGQTSYEALLAAATRQIQTSPMGSSIALNSLDRRRNSRSND